MKKILAILIITLLTITLTGCFGIVRTALEKEISKNEEISEKKKEENRTDEKAAEAHDAEESAPNENDEKAIDEEYQSKVDALPSDDDAGRKQLFEEWLHIRYPGEYDEYQPAEKEAVIINDLQALTMWIEFCDPAGLSDEEMFEAAIGYYLNGDKNIYIERYDFAYEYYDDYNDCASYVKETTIDDLLYAIFGKRMKTPNVSPDEGNPCIDGVYTMGCGDFGDVCFSIGECYKLNDDTLYIVFIGTPAAEEKDYDDVTGIVVKYNTESPFGFNVIARRGFDWQR